MTLIFTVPGAPAPQGSKRGYVAGGKVRMVESSNKVAAWRADVVEAAHRAIVAGRPQEYPITGTVRVRLLFAMPRPKAHYRTGKHAGELRDNAADWHTSRPDVDKLARAALDALGTAGVFRDDSQVCELIAHKVYADAEPSLHVTVNTP